MINSGIVIDEPWIGMILDGDKTWEMRSTVTSVRGQIALIRKGSGRIVGVASIKDCLGPLSLEQMLASQGKHGIGQDLITSGKVDKWRYAWVLDDVSRLVEPVTYSHPKGAVIWVKLSAATSAALQGVTQGSEMTTVRRTVVSDQAHEIKPQISAPDVAGEIQKPHDRMDHVGIDKRVPFAKDGSFFGRHLDQRGYYQVGAKGEETKYRTYEEALSALRAMKTARWRRPNSSGNWGIVSATRWEEPK